MKFRSLFGLLLFNEVICSAVYILQPARNLFGVPIIAV